MINDKTSKLITILLVIFFIAGLFFSIRFLKDKIDQAINPSSEEQTEALNMDAWAKIKHHFQ